MQVKLSIFSTLTLVLIFGQAHFAVAKSTEATVLTGGALESVVLYQPPAIKAPSGTLVIFLHANVASSHLLYSSLLRSIANAGHTAAFVTYQNQGENAEKAAYDYKFRILDGISEAVQRTKPARLVFVGHSSGGYLAQYLATHYAEYQKDDPALTAPLVAMVLLEASSIYSSKFPNYLSGHYPLPDLRGADPGMLVVSLVAERAGATNCENPKAMQSLWDIDWKAQQHFKRNNFLMIPHQAHGRERLVSNHLDPLAMPLNQFDRFGYERLTLAALSCVSNGTRCDEALGQGPHALHLGTFKDGTPLAPMVTPKDLFKPGGRAECGTLKTLTRQVLTPN